MRVQALLPDPELVHLEYLAPDAESITLVVTTSRTAVPCPDCARPAQRVHSRYVRTVADLPWNGVKVRLRLRSQRFFCGHGDCPRVIFTERLPGLVQRYARRTVRLAEAIQLIGVALGGEAGARLAAALGLAVSPTALLERLRRASSEATSVPKVLGVDDFAFRKGMSYGTILVDMERGRPIELLPDRRAETLATWLKEHPGVQLITRDRSFEFAKGITEGAPAAVQVADRFHLLSNLRETLERVVERHRHRLSGIVVPAARAEPVGSVSTGEATSRPRQPAKRSPVEQATRRARSQCRLSLRQEVHALRQQGASILGISQELNLNRSTVYRYLRQEPGCGATRTRCVGSSLDAHLPYLCQRWSEGCHNGNQLGRELRERGYRGSRKMVAVWAQHQRETPAPTTPTKYLAAKASAPGKSPATAATVASRLPSTRRVSWLLFRQPDQLSAEERVALAKIQRSAPELAAIHPLVQEFQRLVRKRELAAFSVWRENALSSGLPDLRSFVAGLDRDREAVEAALRLPWSNGPVEGHVNRLKLLKRQMYGRAGFDLLRARVLRAA
jgi:transposase